MNLPLALSQAARAGRASSDITPQDLCPSQQATLPCVWSPDQLQAPTFGAIDIDLGGGMSVDIVQVCTTNDHARFTTCVSYLYVRPSLSR